MKTEKISISVKPEMKKFILKRGSTEFDSVSQYIRKLVLADSYRLREEERQRNGTWDRIALARMLASERRRNDDEWPE